MKKLIFKITQIILGVGVFAIVALLLLGHFGYINTAKPFVVQSGSMEPAIKTGSVVFSFPQTNYQQGDIITFFANGNKKQTITHRVEFKTYPNGIDKDPVYLTAGDANEEIDNWQVTNDQIIGKASLTIPYLGYAVDFAKKPQGFILLVIIPATIVIYEELKNLFLELINGFKKLKQKRQKNNFVNLQGPSPQDSRTISTLPQQKSKFTLSKSWAIVPAMGAGIVIVAFSAGYFLDLETSLANILGASATYGEKVASLYNSDPYTCPTGAGDTTGITYGISIMKIVGSDVKVSVKLVGATPSSTYNIWINQDPGGCPLASPSFPTALTTDTDGNGQATNLTVPLVQGATNFWISAVGGGKVLRGVAVTLP